MTTSHEIGTFKGAFDPNTKSFREFPDYVNDEQRIRAAERQKQDEISKALGRKHIGATLLEREQWREMKLKEREEANRKKSDCGEA